MPPVKKKARIMQPDTEQPVTKKAVTKKAATKKPRPKKPRVIKEPTVNATCDERLNLLRNAVDRQIKREAAAQVIQGQAAQQIADEIEQGHEEIAQALDQLTISPFANGVGRPVITLEQYQAIHAVRAAVSRELQAPSKSFKKALRQVGEQLTEAFVPESDDEDWEPVRYRVLDPNADDYDPYYMSASDQEDRDPMNIADWGKDAETWAIDIHGETAASRALELFDYVPIYNLPEPTQQETARVKKYSKGKRSKKGRRRRGKKSKRGRKANSSAANDESAG